MVGKHEVLTYFADALPGTRRCYVYVFHRKNKDCDVYRCRGCKQAGVHRPIKVLGDTFLTDPTSEGHVCMTVDLPKDKVERRTHEKCLQVRNDARYAACSTNEILEDMLQEYEDDVSLGTAEERAAVRLHFHRRSLDSRRRTVERSKEAHKDKMVTWNSVPPSLANLSDGSVFLQAKTANLHKACKNGLMVLVADGMHKVLPRQLGDNTQLYTIHGVCRNGHQVPLVPATTKKKNKAVYEEVFGRLKQALNSLDYRVPLRIVLDFEKAAINAAKKVFPDATVRGCAFHLAQAWNRKRNELGLKQFIKGRKKSVRIARSWSTLKGLVFLPQDMYCRIIALTRPPVPPTHEAYRRCKDFLDYLHTT
ncbi:hypothetical protein ANCCAN_08904 [Ancylostoma caninum]|uniref:MULE transposase domain-containing protein n=1 Tax=Ancylostoma caninum TaxID=29170 RepID=A0A368GL65_ANCCA|nr:hypothetical protein ANCCAN_08904 [Ancylostoma caninum]